MNVKVQLTAGKSKHPILAILCTKSEFCTTDASSEHGWIRIESEMQPRIQQSGMAPLEDLWYRATREYA